MLAAFINVAKKWIPGLLPRLVTERPDLLIDHALAYAELAKAEFQAVKRGAVRRVVAGGVALISGLSFFILAGVAVMLNATQELKTDATWMLFVVPGVMLVLSLIATIVASKEGGGSKPVKSLTDQVRLDLQAYRTAMDDRS